MQGIYSPKIREDLIHDLYILSKHFKKPMTKFVSDNLEEVIKKHREDGTFDKIEKEKDASRQMKRLLKDRRPEEIVALLKDENQR